MPAMGSPASRALELQAERGRRKRARRKSPENAAPRLIAGSAGSAGSVDAADSVDVPHSDGGADKLDAVGAASAVVPVVVDAPDAGSPVSESSTSDASGVPDAAVATENATENATEADTALDRGTRSDTATSGDTGAASVVPATIEPAAVPDGATGPDAATGLDADAATGLGADTATQVEAVLVAVVERPVPPAPADDGAELAVRARRRARRRFWGVAVLLVAVVGGVATYNLRAATTLQAAVVAVPSTTVLTPGTPPVLPWPTVGESAVVVPAVGFSSQSGAEQSVPIASLTKLMAAWVILHDHPLAAGQDGPSVTMTSVDVEDVAHDDETDQANVPVADGEILNERQLLEGLIVHSANNLADTLARWDAGTVPAFVAKMNAAAASLGMTNTHYVDADGFESQSVSTAADVLKVAAQLMANPTFAEIAQLQSVTLPVAGTEDTYTPLLGTHDVVGVKSGFTSEAGGCDVLALSQMVDGRKVLVLAAVTGQLGASPLAQAGMAALAVADAATTGVHSVQALTRGQLLANVLLRGTSVPAVAARDASVLAWAGTPVRVHLDLTHRPEGGAGRGTRIGVGVVESGAQRSVAPARLTGRLPTASLAERLF